MLSLIYPICNRTGLFENTLSQMAQQTEKPSFEIVVVDDGGTCPNLIPLLRMYRDLLPIRYLRIDVSRMPYPVFRKKEIYNNPCAALNVGIRQARGERIVLSCPEVQQEGNALQQMANLPDAPAWICSVNEEGGPIAYDGRPLNFLAMFQRDVLLAIGGFEERFISGIGFEDSEFMARFQKSYSYAYASHIVGYHQTHERDPPSDGLSINHGLEEGLNADPEFKVANIGHDWGSEHLIVTDSLNDGQTILTEQLNATPKRFGVHEIVAALSEDPRQDTAAHYAVLYSIARFLPAHRALEIGVDDGSTTIPLLVGVAEHGGTLISVDPSPCEAAQAAVAISGYATNWLFVQKPSAAIAEEIPDGSLDLVWVDGDHSYEGVAFDWRLFSPKVRVGGMMLFHDKLNTRDFPGIARVIDEEIRPRPDWEQCTLPYGWGCTIARRLA